MSRAAAGHPPGRGGRRKGGALVEFALVALLLVIVLLSIVEFSRMLLVYTSVASTARLAARYAIVHGGEFRTGSGSAGPSCGLNPPEIVSIINSFSRVGLADPNRLNISVTYPDGGCLVGNRVSVTIQYPYDPWVALPLTATLASTTQGVITY